MDYLISRENSALHKRLLDLGYILPLAGGVQVDLNTVLDSSGREFSICNHNCTSEVGGYDCPAAFTKNKNLKPNYVSLDSIKSYIRLAARGIRLTRDGFLSTKDSDVSYLGQTYSNRFNIPTSVFRCLETSLKSEFVEVNLFGGNPEMYPKLIPLIKALKSQKDNLKVNLTTTGRRFIFDSEFTHKFLKNPPDSLSLSVDDISIEVLKILLSLDLPGIKDYWFKVNPLQGQEKKAVEAIYALKLLSEKIPITLNCVIHPGNISQVKTLAETFNKVFPLSFFNPFPFQSTFDSSYTLLSLDYLTELENLVDYFLDRTLKLSPGLSKRVHYWIFLKSVLKTHYSIQTKSYLLTGGGWSCFKDVNLGYVQLGGGVKVTDSPGGKLGCYWNKGTISEDIKISSPQDIFDHLVYNRKTLSESVPIDSKCGGCIMPRLMFSGMSTEIGMHPKIVSGYLNLRKLHLGF